MFALSTSAATLVPVKLNARLVSSAKPRASFQVVAGTGKGFGRVHHNKPAADIDYSKHITGYDDMSRPQKYRARKHVKQMMNKMEHDQAQHGAVKNASELAKKAYTAFMGCVDLCEGPDCVDECKVEWGMN